jgi:hypothetical protein
MRRHVATAINLAGQAGFLMSADVGKQITRDMTRASIVPPHRLRHSSRVYFRIFTRSGISI